MSVRKGGCCNLLTMGILTLEPEARRLPLRSTATCLLFRDTQLGTPWILSAVVAADAVSIEGKTCKLDIL